jgi:hypothetical protein
MQAIETELRETAKDSQMTSHEVSSEIRLSKLLQLRRTRDHQIFQIEKITRKDNRYKIIIALRRVTRSF